MKHLPFELRYEACDLHRDARAGQTECAKAWRKISKMGPLHIINAYASKWISVLCVQLFYKLIQSRRTVQEMDKLKGMRVAAYTHYTSMEV